MELKAEVKCPACGCKLTIKVGDMVPGRKQSCPKCHAAITFTGDDGRKAQRALDDLEKTIKKLSR